MTDSNLPETTLLGLSVFDSYPGRFGYNKNIKILTITKLPGEIPG
jgi:hypothetical protein